MERQGQAASTSAGPRQTMTPEEKAAGIRFLIALAYDYVRYTHKSEEEEEEEYRRAGKLHRYDPDKEWQKRYARVARMYPPPKQIAPHLDEYMKLLEEDEADENQRASAAPAA